MKFYWRYENFERRLKRQCKTEGCEEMFIPEGKKSFYCIDCKRRSYKDRASRVAMNKIRA